MYYTYKTYPIFDQYVTFIQNISQKLIFAIMALGHSPRVSTFVIMFSLSLFYFCGNGNINFAKQFANVVIYNGKVQEEMKSTITR